MECEKLEGLFTGWAAGSLTKAEKEQMERHLDTCAGCREELAGMQLLWSTMGDMKAPEPSANMQVKFEAMLNTFKADAAEKQRRSLKVWLGQLWANQPRWPMSYNIAVILVSFCCGYFVFMVGKGGQQTEQLQALSSQVHELKQTMTLAMLENPSASERIKGVSYTAEMKRVDPQVIEALLTTLDNDPNVNVRLSTLDALTHLVNYPDVRAGLIRSITEQDSPLVQVAIADVMLKLQEKQSVGSLKKLLKQKDLDNGVREKINDTIKHLI
ncbi:zf-HC2 domain-containing protein [Mucilaginibacter sp. dw_454]|uniref:zf-HC2 domain-containing protein n=1 Tax=Mucilaginibacter sp. dw_454 TaxID=2720079 RepID=UPI001BD30310|nr:zf-HC2 domain-containing protein [Mucilaginibacter sp. dw_454]